MLTRQPTLIWEPVKPQSPKPHISYMDKRHLIPSPPPSAGASSVASSYSDEDEYDAIARAPNLFLYVSRQHYETWDAKPGDILSFSGSFFVPSGKMVMRSGAELVFSHFELEVKTHGRQGRYSRENMWSPSYIDFCSSPTTTPLTTHLARTRNRTGITWGPRTDHLHTGAIRSTYRVGIPEYLFRKMRTRLLRVSGRAVYVGVRRSVVYATEVIEADPIIVTMSHLRMMEDMLGYPNSWYS